MLRSYIFMTSYFRRNCPVKWKWMMMHSLLWVFFFVLKSTRLIFSDIFQNYGSVFINLHFALTRKSFSRTNR